ncbi:uncharacterized protein LOC134216680 [Armigeres subalbatus]|uniref:uncharacterized protein LOC134216680 n=1 Tax=Armigeres subalbatus TaxID=124917 RepID=UPI002ED5DE2F
MARGKNAEPTTSCLPEWPQSFAKWNTYHPKISISSWINKLTIRIHRDIVGAFVISTVYLLFTFSVSKHWCADIPPSVWILDSIGFDVRNLAGRTSGLMGVSVSVFVVVSIR